MKKKLIYLFLLLFIGQSSFGSVSFIMKQHYAISGSQVIVPIKVKDFVNIMSIQGTIQFDPSILSYVSAQDFGLSGMNSSWIGLNQIASGQLTFLWVDPGLAGINLPDSTTIFSIKFNVIGSNGQVSSLSFIDTPTPMEVINGAMNPVSFTLVSGAVHVQNSVSNTIVFKLDSITGTQGSQVSASLRSMGFTNIISTQGTIQFDPAVVTYVGIGSYGLPGMTSGNFGVSLIAAGKLTFSWLDGSFAGQNLANGAPLFSILFNLTGSTGTQTTLSLIDAPTPLEVTDSLQNQVATAKINGRINIIGNTTLQTLRLKIDSVAGPNGSQVVVPVRAWHFRKIISMQGTISFNTAIATYSAVEQFGLTNMDANSFGTSQVANGKLMFSWSDGTNAGTTVSDSSILFAIRFNVVGVPGNITPLNFINTPTPLEFTDTTFSAMGSILQPGRIRVSVNSFITALDPAILSYCAGNPITVSYTASGYFNPNNNFILQLSDQFGSFVSPINIDTIVSTLGGTFTANLPSSLVAGTLYHVRVISTNPMVFGTMNPSSIIISTVPTIAATPSGTLSMCQGTGSGVYTTTGANGATSYQWDINPSTAGTTLSTSTSATITWSPLYNGSVSVTVRGINSCGNGVYSSAVSVSINPIPAAPTVTVVNNCGNSVLSTTATGSLLWSTFGTTSSITVVTAGTYTVTQTVLGCISGVGSGTAAPLTVPSTPIVNVVNNCGNSVLSTTALGSLLWSSGGQTTSSITVSSAGTYTVTQTSGGCTSALGSGVAAPLTVPLTPVVNVVNNCGNSVLSTTALGSLLWSIGGQTTSSITVTTPGSYTVTQTSGGCTSLSGSGIAAPLIIPSTPVVNVVNNCGNSVLSTTTTGTVLWSIGGQTTTQITVVTSGTYTVTQTVGGCTSSAGSGTAAPLVVPSTPVVNVVNNCGNSVLSTTALGSLLWSSGGQTTSSITVTTAGTYSVTQTSGGCTSNPGSGVAAPISIPATPLVNVVNNCGNSVLSTTATGTLLWSPGGQTTTSITVTTPGTYSVTQTVAGCVSLSGSGTAAPLTVPTAPVVNVVNNCGNSVLSTTALGTLLWSPGGQTTTQITVSSAGTYFVTQTIGGCTSLSGSGVAAPLAVPSTPIVNVVNNCGNSVLSTTAPGSLLWSPGGQTTASITVATAGTYTVTQTSGGCTSASGSGVAAPITIPSTPIVNVVNNCGNSVLSTTATGTLLWSPGGQTTTQITVATAGTYSVTQTVGGCTSPVGSNVAAPLIVPATPVVDVTNNCGNSVLSTTATGSLLWSPGGQTTSQITVTTAGTFSVTQTVGGCTSLAGSGIAAPIFIATPVVNVVNNCGNSVLSTTAAGTLLWSPGGQTTTQITVASAGTYTVTQTVGGCSSAPGSGVAAPIAIPTAPVVNVVNNCGNSVLSTTASGTLLWSPGGQTTTQITVTTAGTYSVTQTVSGCISPAGSNIAAPLTVPTTPVVNVTNNCGNTTLSTTAPGTLLWSPGGQTTNPITVTTAGTYTVTQTVGGCTSLAGSGIAAPIFIATPVVNVANNCGNSILSTTATGTLLWTPGGQTTSSITVASAGTYTVTQTVGGCSSAPGSGVAAPTAIPTAPVVNVVNNCGNSVLSTTASGTLLWTPTSLSTSQITVTIAGTYNVTQTIGGCTSPAGSGIAAPLSVPAAPVVNVVNNCGSSTLSTTALGTLLWTPTGLATSQITVTTSGTYSVTQTAGGCTSPAGSGVAAPKVIPVVNLGNDTAICCNHSLILNAGNTGATYAWLPEGQNTQTINVDTTGFGLGTYVFSVQVTQNGCTGTDSIHITFNACAGIEEIGDDIHISLIPNPSNGMFSINTQGINGEISLFVYAINGSMIYSELKDISGINSNTVDLRRLSKGLYFIKLLIGDKQFVEKLIIE